MLGAVPAAMNTVRAGSSTARASAGRSPSAAAAARVKRIICAAPYSSTSMRAGVRPSANTTPSSSAFATSSWFSVYDGLSISRRR